MQELKDTLPPDIPITGVCIVADLSKIPAGYKAIDRSYDKYEDADLWKDSFFTAKKVYRYFCITREIKSQDVIGGDVVLADIALIGEKESLPIGFSPIDNTIDTREKATKGKRVVMKLLPRENTTDGICDLIILSKSKRPPGDYTLVGEMNGLSLCFKMGQVPRNPKSQKPAPLPYAPPNVITQPGVPYWNGQMYGPQPRRYTDGAMEATHQQHLTQAPTDRRYTDSSSMYGQQPYGDRGTTLQRHLATSPLSGVPFQLNKRFADNNLTQFALPDMGYKSIMDIEREFEYNFNTERSVRSRSPST